MSNQSNKASQAALEELHSVIAKELTERIRSGEAKPADISAAIQFLRNNGIDATPQKGSPLEGLLDSMPFPDQDGEPTPTH